MLQKHYPLAVIGKSYLSLIYGIELLRYFDRILLLDDDRLSFGDLYQNGLTEMDRSFLKTFGQDRNIEELKEGQFLRPSPYILHSAGTEILLGRSPWENIRELTRKFYDLFPYDFLFLDQRKSEEVNDEAEKGDILGQEELNKDYHLFCERLGLNGLRFKSIENFTLQYLMGHCPDSLKMLYRLFAKQVNENPEVAKYFLYFGRALFHKKLSSSYTELELFHFFICIIGPHYELEVDSLSQCLSREFTQRGGHYKEAQVREWKFYKRNPWSIELSSFEGIIHPQKISFLGAHPTGLPLKVEYPGNTFHSIHFEVLCNDERIFQMSENSEASFHLFGDQLSLGTDFPFCKFVFKDSRIFGQFLYREKKGSKLEFYKDSLKKKLSQHLGSLFPGIEDSIEHFHLNKGREVFMDQSDVYITPDMVKLKQVGLFDFSIPTVNRKLKNVYYYGPLKSGPLGVFGQLMEIKETPKYQ
ncbi:MAG: hypothetical protein CME63_01860 [Halobacteriovoraceae bacterium]|nr:hypothetical protein [Halobacteriovoraceae bacterium]